MDVISKRCLPRPGIYRLALPGQETMAPTQEVYTPERLMALLVEDRLHDKDEMEIVSVQMLFQLTNQGFVRNKVAIQCLSKRHNLLL